MSFAFEDFPALVALLDQHPEWLEQLRVRLLTRELLELPDLHRQLTQNVALLGERVDRLATGQDQLTQRMDQLTQRMDQLTVRMDQLTHDVRLLTGNMSEMNRTLGEHSGQLLEMEYARKGAAYFSRIARRLRPLDFGVLDGRLEEAVEHGLITEPEGDDVMATDLVMEGKRRADGADVYLLAEISWKLGDYDVERARRRSAILSRLGKPAIPVVAGRSSNDFVNHLARTSGVWVLTNGVPTEPSVS